MFQSPSVQTRLTDADAFLANVSVKLTFFENSRFAAEGEYRPSGILAQPDMWRLPADVVRIPDARASKLFGLVADANGLDPDEPIPDFPQLLGGQYEQKFPIAEFSKRLGVIHDAAPFSQLRRNLEIIETQVGGALAHLEVTFRIGDPVPLNRLI